MVDELFAQWGLDFFNMINNISSVGYKWILIAIDYFTSFGPPRTNISNNAKAFLGCILLEFSLQMVFS